MTCDLDATRIVSHVYQGSMPPLGHEVRRCGFDALVLAAREYQPPAVEFPGVVVVHAPIDDAVLTRDEWRTAKHAAVRVERLVRSGARVLITCAMGRNRSGLITALALKLLTRKRNDEIVALIRACRAGALTNQTFVRALYGVTK